MRSAVTPLFVGLLVGASAFAACASPGRSIPPLVDHDAGPEAGACGTETALVCPPSPPRYVDEIAPLIAAKCGNAGCHDGLSGPWPLTTYQTIQAWSDVIAYQLVQCAMPPADGGTPLSDPERALLLNWIACGTPAPDGSLQ